MCERRCSGGGVGDSGNPVSEPRGRRCSAGGVAGPNTSDVEDFWESGAVPKRRVETR